jgi:hypothetical protein
MKSMHCLQRLAKASALAALALLLTMCSKSGGGGSVERSRASDVDTNEPASFPQLDFGDDDDDEPIQLGPASKEKKPEKCGGVAHISCMKGYVCRLDPEESSDPMGTCVRDPRGETRRLAGVGERCAGLAGIECEDGLACKMDDAEQTDAMGTCIARAPSGTTLE